jgi:hypothetical protein
MVMRATGGRTIPRVDLTLLDFSANIPMQPVEDDPASLAPSDAGIRSQRAAMP